MNFLNMFSNHKSKHVVKGAIPEIEKKQNKFTREPNPSEKYEQNITNKSNNSNKKTFSPENANFDHNKFFHKY